MVCRWAWAAVGLVFLGVMAPVLAAAAAKQAPAIATQVHLTEEAGGATLVVDLSADRRAVPRALDRPPRLLLDFPGVVFAGASPTAPAASGGTVIGIRAGAVAEGHGRIVLDLARPLRLEEQRFVPRARGGGRLVLRLAAGPPDPLPVDGDPLITGSTRPAKAAAAVAAARPVVVIDPGHGGIDPGATGPGGEVEKVIALDFGLALRDRLRAGGLVEVVLTRESDVFVPLRDRVRIAREARAALFLSIHADSLPSEDGVRGATLYTLSDRATDERSRRLADKENLADRVAGIELKDDQDEVAGILFDLARRETRAFSLVLARHMVETLPAATRLHRIPLKAAGFRVLRAPDVPSVLLELGYLSNAEEARLMTDPAWRRGTVEAVAEAIERFVRERLLASERAARGGSP